MIIGIKEACDTWVRKYNLRFNRCCLHLTIIYKVFALSPVIYDVGGNPGDCCWCLHRNQNAKEYDDIGKSILSYDFN